MSRTRYLELTTLLYALYNIIFNLVVFMRLDANFYTTFYLYLTLSQYQFLVVNFQYWLLILDVSLLPIYTFHGMEQIFQKTFLSIQ